MEMDYAPDDPPAQQTPRKGKIFNPMRRRRFCPVIEKYRPDFGPFVSVYKHLHQNPDLSTHEYSTSRKINECLESIGLEIMPRVGRIRFEYSEMDPVEWL